MSPMKRYFELTEGTSGKFWEIALLGSVVVITHGRLGTEGTVTEKGAASADAAQELYDTLVREKVAQGYVLKSGAALPANLTRSVPARSAAVKAGEARRGDEAGTPRRFECKEGGSSKFWEITVKGRGHTVRFGKIGTPGQEKKKAFGDAAAATADAAKLVAEKTRKGYVEVGAKGRGAARPPTPAKVVADPSVPKPVAVLRKLAAAARDGKEPLTRTYVLVAGKPSAGSRGVMRAGGAPIGVTTSTRPRVGASKTHKQHLVTLDLDVMPELRAAHRKLAKARAVAVFIDDAKDNEAFDESTSETAVVVLTDAQVAGGEWGGPPVADPKARSLSAWPVDVPARVFTYDPWGSDDEPDEKAPLHKLYEALMSENRAGGGLIDWSDSIESAKGWLFQLTEDIVDVNLGDAGTMFVFADRAFWHGH